MIEKEYIELINKDIDKVINASEKEKLQNYLIKNPDAQAYFEDLRLLNNYLNRIPDPEPPAGLSKRIINSINFGNYKPKSFKHFLPRFNISRTSNYTKIAYLFVGMFVGFFVYALLVDNNSFNKNDVTGTIGIENKKIQSIKEVHINNEGISGSIQVLSAGDSFWFDVDLDSSQPFNLAVTHGKEVEFIDFSPNTLSFTKADDLLKVSNSAGQQHFYIFFSKNNDEAALKIEIEQSGSILFYEKLLIN